MSLESAREKLDDIRAKAKTLTQESPVSPAQHEENRRHLLAEAQKLVQTLEKPEEGAFRLVFESHSYSFCVRIGIDLGIFHALTDVSPAAITAGELAKRANAEELFLVRVMRVLTAIGYASEVGEMEYAATVLSKVMARPQIEAHAVHSYEHAARVANRMPEYFSRNGYKCPIDTRHGPFQYALGTDLSFFDFIDQNPARRVRFDMAMTGNKGLRRQWFQWFPVHEHLLTNFESQQGEIFLVDMGGGKGQYLEQFCQTFPETSGHLVLQDLPGTIDSLQPLPPGIRAMAHDMFTKQPVLGALVYYTHFFLHDFPDADCRTMLRHTAGAMRPGHSRILLNEIIIPERGCPSLFAAADITMMACLAGMQRTAKQWVALVESAGLVVTKIWLSPDPGDFEGVVEIELPSGS